MPAPTDAPPGSSFGAYEVIGVLGAGGMGTVYEGRHRGLGKRVAIKSLHAHYANDGAVIARFVREAQAASRLHHPNVAEVYDVGVEDGLPYLVMELLRGDTLRQLLDREGRLTPVRALSLLCPIAAALDAAHREGVVHRDVKPENILIAEPKVGPPVPKLLDFGIAKLRQEGGSLTSNSDVFGTPSYMSPEQTRGAKHVDARSDQYSLAAIVYECLTGHQPYEAANVMALVFRIQSEPVPPARSHVPDLHAGLDAVLLRAMAREPDARFPTIGAFLTSLLAFADPATRAQWLSSADPMSAPTLVERMDSAPFVIPVLARTDPSSGRHPAANAFHPVAWSASRFETPATTTTTVTTTTDRFARGLLIGGAGGGIVGVLVGSLLIGLITIGDADETSTDDDAPHAARETETASPPASPAAAPTTPSVAPPQAPPIVAPAPTTVAAPSLDLTAHVPIRIIQPAPDPIVTPDAGPEIAAEAPADVAAREPAGPRRGRPGRSASPPALGSNRAPILR